MPKINIYVSDQLAEAISQYNIQVSNVCQRALEQELYSKLSLLNMTPRTRKVLTLAAKEAEQLGHKHIGTEHLLLAIILEGNGIAAQILEQMNISSTLRQSLLEFIAKPDYISPTNQIVDKEGSLIGYLVTDEAGNIKLQDKNGQTITLNSPSNPNT